VVDYEVGATALRDSRYLTAPERWLALKRYDLNVARESRTGPASNPKATVARAAFEGSFGLAVPVGLVLQVAFAAYMFLGPETEGHLPAQAAFVAVASAMIAAAFLRGKAASRHFLQG